MTRRLLLCLSLIATLLAVPTTGILAGEDGRLEDFSPTVPTDPAQGSQLSVDVSEWRFPDGDQPTAFLAAERDFPDSMTVGAYAVGIPFLLTSTGALDAEVAAELDRLGTSEVTIYGGPAVVGPEVVTALEARDIDVTRIFGDGRHETAAAAVQARIDALQQLPGPLVITRDNNVADSLAIVEHAAAIEAAVLLSRTNSLPDATRQVIEDNPARFTEIIIVGGPNAISEAVEEELRTFGPPVRRIAGPDRVATAYELYADMSGEVGSPEPGRVHVIDPYTDLAWALAYTAADRSGLSRMALVNRGDMPAATAAFLDTLDPDIQVVCMAQLTACNRVLVQLGQDPIGAAPFDGIVVPGAADYATHERGDAWDYSQRSDIILAGSSLNGRGEDIVVNVTRAEVTGGVLDYSTSGPSYISVLWQGALNTMPVTGEGVALPIDGSVYTEMVARLHVDAPTTITAGVETVRGQTGGTNFPISGQLSPGWHVVRYQHGTPQPLIGLRLGTSTQVNVKLDWVRVISQDAAAGAAFPYDCGGGCTATPVGSPGIEGLSPRFEGGRVYADALPASDWTVTTGDGQQVALRIAEPPRVRFANPDDKGGEDFITAAVGDPWDFSQQSDIAAVGGADQQSLDGGILRAVNRRAAIGDPFVSVNMHGRLLDPNRYHRVTVRYGNDGPFDLGHAEGGGSHGRLIWRRGTDFDDGTEVIAYPELVEYTFSMTHPEALEPGANSWLGAPLDLIRFDPNEDPGPRGWFIDHLEIRADDESTGRYTIEVDEFAPASGSQEQLATATIRLDTDRSGGDGAIVAEDVLLQVGARTQVPITTCGLAPGGYWAHITATRDGATFRGYSSGPLQVLNTAC